MHLQLYLNKKGNELKQDEKFNKLYKFLDIFALATSIFHFLTGLLWGALITYDDLINENITADEKWKKIKDKIVENDISEKLSIFRYTNTKCKDNEDVDFNKLQEPEKYKNLDSNFVNILIKKVFLESNIKTFDVVTIDDFTNSDFYKELESLVKEEENLV